MIRLLVLAVALAASLAGTFSFSLDGRKAPNAEEITLAFDRVLSSVSGERPRTIITALDPALCVWRSSTAYSGAIFRCPIKFETAWASGERQENQAALTLAPFERSWAVVRINTLTN